ncbi:polyprenyl synthetase family protein [Chungangia koreensis]|uniref:Polyprenyl synthetase family protein n=1 Tax=Chungangia koreensis TaxID=752657 RepID=A0ABV8X5F4_9LACT
MMDQKLHNFIENQQKLIDEELIAGIKELKIPTNLSESMKYSLEAGGKRIRPMLIQSVLNDFGKSHADALKVGAAVEMIHTYSLIHDDLPSMDDDDFRRGKPTNHKVYGEAVAILAGDALLTYSFGVLARMDNIEAELKLELISLLSETAGAEGMVGGQIMDLEGESKQLSLQELEQIHLHKTGELLRFSIEAGAILAEISQEERLILREYAVHIGLAFQIQDDILDITGTMEQLGKTAGKDVISEKSTYPSLLTLTGAQEKLQQHHDKALEALGRLSLQDDMLRRFADYIVNRAN